MSKDQAVLPAEERLLHSPGTGGSAALEDSADGVGSDAIVALLLNLTQHINRRLALVDQSDNSPLLTLGNDVRATSPGHVVVGLVAR